MLSSISEKNTMASTPLSPEVLELIKKAQIVSFATWQDSHSSELIQVFQAADDRRLYLTDEELQQIARLTPERTAGLPVAAMLRNRVVEIVNEARSGVLAAFPQILEPGGGLYPAERADACWRDFWHFLRCITYGIAGQRQDYLSAEGLGYMNLLYQELQVPLDAMVVGLEGIKIASLQRIDPSQKQPLSVYFDRLILQLKQFNPG
jgi:Phycobilisome protein